MVRFLIAFSLCLGVAGCTRVVYVPSPVCPYGPPYMLPSDYEVLANPDMISDQLADWILANGMFCDEVGNGL